MKKIIIILFFVPLLFGCTNNETSIQNESTINIDDATESSEGISSKESEIDTSNWQTYRNEEYGFEMKYPENWINNERKDENSFLGKDIPGFILSIGSGEKNTPSAIFWMHLRIVDLSRMDDLEKIQEEPLSFFKSILDRNRTSYEGLEIVNIGTDREKFTKAIRRTGSYQVYMKVKDNTLFLIEFHDPDTEGIYEKTKKVVNTFRFIESY